MPAVPALDEANFRALYYILGNTITGITGTEIGTLFRERGIADRCPGITKRQRLYEARVQRQRSDGLCEQRVSIERGSASAVRAAACKALRQRWHSRQRRQRRVCNLQNLRDPVGFESHPLRHLLSQ
jgi:hypothetical protein